MNSWELLPGGVASERVTPISPYRDAGPGLPLRGLAGSACAELDAPLTHRLECLGAPG